MKKLNKLNKGFSNIKVDRNTIEVFKVIDDKFIKKEEDAIFEGKIPLKDIPKFIPKYQAATSYSELNASLSDV